MPTAGKVLTILLIPVAIAWLVLASMATQRNRFQGEKIVQLNKQLEDLVGTVEKVGEVDRVRAEVETLKREIAAQQSQTSRETTTLRARLSQLESLVALTREDLTRVQLLVQDTEKQMELARQIAERRTQEKADTEKAIGAVRQELDTLTQEDAQLRERRESLLREFESLLAENKQLVERLMSASRSAN